MIPHAATVLELKPSRVAQHCEVDFQMPIDTATKQLGDIKRPELQLCQHHR